MADTGEKTYIARQETSEEILGKLDPMQQSIIARIGGLLADSEIFIADGTFTVPAGVSVINVTGCGAGSAIYAGEYIFNKQFNVEGGTQFAVKVGADKATELGDLVYLGCGALSESANTDWFNTGHNLGLSGNGGGKCSLNSNVKSGSGGYGGAFGYGGSGGESGIVLKTNGDSSSVAAGKAVGTTHILRINDNEITFAAGQAGNSTNTYDGGDGGNAGGFGAGGGGGGTRSYIEGTWTGTKGASGEGSQGFLIIKWGVI